LVSVVATSIPKQLKTNVVSPELSVRQGIVRLRQKNCCVGKTLNGDA